MSFQGYPGARKASLSTLFLNHIGFVRIEKRDLFLSSFVIAVLVMQNMRIIFLDSSNHLKTQRKAEKSGEKKEETEECYFFEACWVA